VHLKTTITVKLTQIDYNFVDTAVTLYNVCLAKCGLHLLKVVSILNIFALLVMNAAI